MTKDIQAITQALLAFRDQRDWGQFHTPKDLAISLSLEASELLECFQWKDNKAVEAMLKGETPEEIKDELADVASYLLLLCAELDVDLMEAVEKKMHKNALKYPVEKAKGHARKYDKL